MKTPFFYGWVIVAVAFLSHVVLASQGQVLGVLINPMTDDLGWSKTQMVGAISLASLAGGFSSPLVGPLFDKYGSRFPMAAAALIAGAILLATSWVHSLLQFYILNGILIGLFRAGIGEIPTGTAVANWFIRQRGKASAIAVTGTPVGAAILVPLAQFILGHYGWRAVWIAMAVLLWLLIALPSILFMRRRPEDMGLLPDGRAPTITADGRPSPADDEPSFTAREAIRSRNFWLVLLALILSTGMGGPVIILFLVPYLTGKGISPEAAAAGYTVFSVGWIGARVLWGVLVDKIHVRYCFMLYLTGISTGMLVLILLPPNVAPVLVVLGFMGLMFGGGGIVSTIIWPNYFGRKSIGAIRGLSAPFRSVAGALSPLLVAFLYDKTKSYQIGFILSALWQFSAIGAIFFARPLAKKQPASQPAGPVLTKPT